MSGSGLTPASLADLLGLPEPTAEQAAVIAAPLGAGLVVAGAGSGKTETMAARVVYLVATRQVLPGEVLGLTFTRKAAGELAGRIGARLDTLLGRDPELAAVIGADDRVPTVSTYDAFAAQVVADHGLRLGVEPGAHLLRPAQAWQLADRVVRGWDGDFSGYEPSASTLIDVVRGLHDQLASHCLDVSTLRAHLDTLIGQVRALPPIPTVFTKAGVARRNQPSTESADEFLARQVSRLEATELVERYQRLLAEVGAVDFASIAAIAARLAAEVPEVAAAQRAARRLVLLDEFQDTSPAQLRLVTGAFAGLAVTAVGDPHQSIYGWRGAGADTLGAFADTHPGGQPYTLSTTFRNAPPVLAAANAVAAPLQRATRVKVAALRARAGRGGGLVAVALYGTLAEELAAVTARARDAWAAGRSVAVLVRTRRQVEPLLDALRGDGVEVEVVGLAGLLGVPVVVEVLSVLRAMADPDRGDALVRVLTGPRWRLGPRDLEGLGRLAAGLRRRADPAGDVGVAAGDEQGVGEVRLLRSSDEPVPGVVDALDHLLDHPSEGSFSQTGRHRLLAAAAELRTLRSRADAPLGEVVADVVATTGLGTELAALAGSGAGELAVAGGGAGGRAAGRAAVADLAAFIQEAERYAGAPGPTSASAHDRAALPAFLAYLDVAEERERGLERADADPDPEPESVPETVTVRAGRVQLLTVHAAKGLEWDVVCVPGMVEDVFPARARVPRGWVTDLAQLPHALRADRAGLPGLNLAAMADLSDLKQALADHDAGMRQLREDEERRLAYVAVTRAREVVAVSGHRWSTTKRPRQPSRFLCELREVGLSVSDEPGWQLGPWVADPGEQPEAVPRASAVWPGPLLDPILAARVEAGAALVAEQAATLDEGYEPDVPGTAEEVAWARDADLLLAERERSAPAADRVIGVAVPAVVSVSGLVAIARDPDAYALALRRPVPRQPRVATRLGTRFHAWLEQRWSAERLVDLGDLPGSADDPDSLAPLLDDAALRELQDAFRAGPWADRTPTEVEYPFVTHLGGRSADSSAGEGPAAGLVLRGRIDAVFIDSAAGRVEVVDWKTGPPPDTARRMREVAVQLAAYRLAWHRATGTPLAAISGAFVHVAVGVTVRPADLLDEAGLLALVGSLPTAVSR